jgi:hypothetical protein
VAAVTAVLGTLAPLASLLDDAQDLSSIVLAALAFGAMFLFLKGLDRA